MARCNLSRGDVHLRHFAFGRAGLLPNTRLPALRHDPPDDKRKNRDRYEHTLCQGKPPESVLATF